MTVKQAVHTLVNDQSRYYDNRSFDCVDVDEAIDRAAKKMDLTYVLNQDYSKNHNGVATGMLAGHAIHDLMPD